MSNNTQDCARLQASEAQICGIIGHTKFSGHAVADILKVYL